MKNFYSLIEYLLLLNDTAKIFERVRNRYSSFFAEI